MGVPGPSQALKICMGKGVVGWQMGVTGKGCMGKERGKSIITMTG